MKFLNLLNILSDKPILPGDAEYDWAGAGLTTFVSIVIVFAVLIVIIFITHFLFLGINKTFEAIDKSDSKFARFLKRNKKVTNEVEKTTPAKVEITDDDMMAAVLVATIDYQNEVKTDVRVVSVKEIK